MAILLSLKLRFFRLFLAISLFIFLVLPLWQAVWAKNEGNEILLEPPVPHFKKAPKEEHIEPKKKTQKPEGVTPKRISNDLKESVPESSGTLCRDFSSVRIKNLAAQNTPELLSRFQGDLPSQTEIETFYLALECSRAPKSKEGFLSARFFHQAPLRKTATLAYQTLLKSYNQEKKDSFLSFFKILGYYLLSPSKISKRALDPFLKSRYKEIQKGAFAILRASLLDVESFELLELRHLDSQDKNRSLALSKSNALLRLDISHTGNPQEREKIFKNYFEKSLKSGDREEIILSARALLYFQPNSKIALFELAKLYKNSGSHATEAYYYGKLYHIAPSEKIAEKYILSLSLSQRKNYASVLEQMRKRYPANPLLLKLKAKRLIQEGRLTEALEFLKKNRLDKKTKVNLLLTLSKASLSKLYLVDAEKSLQEARKESPQDFRILLMQAQLFSFAKDEKGSQKAYALAYQFSPNETTKRSYRASLLEILLTQLQKGIFGERELQVFQKYFSLSDDSGDAILYRLLEKRAQNNAHLKDALVVLYQNKGLKLAQNQKTREEGFVSLNRALWLDEKNSKTHRYLSLALSSDGLLEKSLIQKLFYFEVQNDFEKRETLQKSLPYLQKWAQGTLSTTLSKIAKNIPKNTPKTIEKPWLQAALLIWNRGREEAKELWAMNRLLKIAPTPSLKRALGKKYLKWADQAFLQKQAKKALGLYQKGRNYTEPTPLQKLNELRLTLNNAPKSFEVDSILKSINLEELRQFVPAQRLYPLLLMNSSSLSRLGRKKDAKKFSQFASLVASDLKDNSGVDELSKEAFEKGDCLTSMAYDRMILGLSLDEKEARIRLGTCAIRLKQYQIAYAAWKPLSSPPKKVYKDLLLTLIVQHFGEPLVLDYQKEAKSIGINLSDELSALSKLEAQERYPFWLYLKKSWGKDERLSLIQPVVYHDFQMSLKNLSPKAYYQSLVNLQKQKSQGIEVTKELLQLSLQLDFEQDVNQWVLLLSKQSAQSKTKEQVAQFLDVQSQSVKLQSKPSLALLLLNHAVRLAPSANRLERLGSFYWNLALPSQARKAWSLASQYYHPLPEDKAKRLAQTNFIEVAESLKGGVMKKIRFIANDSIRLEYKGNAYYQAYQRELYQRAEESGLMSRQEVQKALLSKNVPFSGKTHAKLKAYSSLSQIQSSLTQAREYQKKGVYNRAIYLYRRATRLALEAGDSFRAKQIQEETSGIYIAYARGFSDQNDNETALVMAHEAVRLDGKNKEALLFLSHIYQKLNKPQQAKIYQNRAENIQ